MASRWYLQQGQQEQGPYKTADLRRMVQAGEVAPDSLVRRGEDGEWVEASRVMGLNPSNSPSESSSAESPPSPPVARAVLPVAQPLPTPQEQPTASATPPVVVRPPRGSRRKRGAGGGRSIGMPVAAMLAIVMVLAVSFGVAGVVIYLWRAGNEAVSSDGATVPADAGTTDAGARPALTPADSPVARDEALLDSIGDWHDAAKLRVGPNGVRYHIVSARLIPEQDLVNLASSQFVVRRPPTEESSPAEVPSPRPAGSDSPLTPKPGGIGAFEAALGEDVGTSRDVPPEVAPRPTDGGVSTPDGVSTPKAPPPTPSDGSPERQVLVVELKIYNLSTTESLHYTGMNGFADERATALLVDQYGKRQLPLPAGDGTAAARIVEFDIAPGHQLTDMLVFQAPEEGFDFVRLALPNAAVGRAGGVGFQINADMVQPANAVAVSPR